MYDRAHEDCRLIYTRLPSPRKIQSLVQVWKQLWKCPSKVVYHPRQLLCIFVLAALQTYGT